MCRVGGTWGDGASAGLFDFSSYDVSSYSSTNIGCRLLFARCTFAVKRPSPHHLVKIFCVVVRLSRPQGSKRRKAKKEMTMKRIGNIYEKTLDPLFIEFAIRAASEGKRKRLVVKRVMDDIDGHVQKIKEMLQTQSFKPSSYHVFERYDHLNKKYRKIQRPKFFPDQIIHWLVVLAIKPALTRGMYFWNCGSIPNRGIKHGFKAVRTWLNTDKKNTRYTLKLDIRKYYDSVPHDKLMAFMRRKIKDEKMLALIEQIVNTTDVGIPIGNYTSQWFANVYLEGLDHYIKEKLGVKYYVRYIDDMILFGVNKKELHKVRLRIAEFLRRELGLELKANWQVYKTEPRGVDFLGYVFRRTHTALRARNFLSFVRQCGKVRRMIASKAAIPFRVAAGLISRLGQLSHCNSFLITKKYLTGIKLKTLKKVVRNESKSKLQPAVA